MYSWPGPAPFTRHRAASAQSCSWSCLLSIDPSSLDAFCIQVTLHCQALLPRACTTGGSGTPRQGLLFISQYRECHCQVSVTLSSLLVLSLECLFACCLKCVLKIDFDSDARLLLRLLIATSL